MQNIFQVLFLELKLPPNCELNCLKNKKSLGYTRRAGVGARIKLSRQFSTTKVSHLNATNNKFILILIPVISGLAFLSITKLVTFLL